MLRSLQFLHRERADGREATSTSRLARNARAIDSFIAAVTATQHLHLVPGTILGPVAVPGIVDEWPRIALYYGKLRTDLSHPGNPA